MPLFYLPNANFLPSKTKYLGMFEMLVMIETRNACTLQVATCNVDYKGGMRLVRDHFEKLRILVKKFYKQKTYARYEYDSHN